MRHAPAAAVRAGTWAAVLLAAAAAAAAANGTVTDLVVTDAYQKVKQRGPERIEHKGPATISFSLSAPAEVVVEIHADASYEPKLVRTMRLGSKPKGYVQATWDGLDEKGRTIYEGWRTFSCTVKAGEAEAKAFWSMPTMPVPKGKTALSVVSGKHLLLAEGDEPVPFALQVLNCGADEAGSAPGGRKYTLAGSVRTPDKTELLKVAGEVTVPAMTVAARTYAVRQRRNGICTARFTAAGPKGEKLSAATTFGRVSPHRKRFERDSAFASVWVSGCKFADAIGVKYSRQNDVNWTDLQKRPDQPYHWGDPRARGPVLDGFIADRERHHMWMLSILGYGEDWLGGSYVGCTLYNYDRYVNDYCAEVARHMRGHYSLLQHWNEPNFFWHVLMDQYYLVQRRVFSRIKTLLGKNAFCMLDGHAGVGSNNRFLRRMAALGTAPYTTALAVHYPEPKARAGSPEGRVDSKVNNMVELFQIRDQHFPALEVWNTEEGLWGRRPWQRDARATARDLPKIYVTQIAAGVERIFWFAMKGDNLAYLLRPGGNISEPAISYAATTHLLEGACFMGYASPAKGVREYLFTNGGRAVLVAWSNAGDVTREVFTHARTVRLLDVYGNPTKRECIDGKAEVTLTASPVWITGASPLLLIDALDTQRRPAQTPAPLLTDAPALMADIRGAAKAAGLDGRVVDDFEEGWNAAVSKLAFVFQSYGRKLPRLDENHPSAMVTRMLEGSAKLREALSGACGKPERIPAGVTGLYKLDCLLERAAAVLAIWPGQDQAGPALEKARQAWQAADSALDKLEGAEYKPAARAYLSQLAKVLRKAERDAADGFGHAAAARARIAQAGCASIATVGAAEPAAVISCVVNVYVKPQRRPLDRHMTLFDRSAVPGESFPVEVNIDNYTAVARRGKLKLLLPAGWASVPAAAEVHLKPNALAVATTFRVTVPDTAETSKTHRVGALFEAGPLKVGEAFPVAVTAVPPIEITGLVADNPAQPAHLVPRAVSHVDATDLTVTIEPPKGVRLAAGTIVLGGAKPGSVRNPHFPLAAYTPGREQVFEVIATAGGHKAVKQFKLKLAGDGTGAKDALLTWEKSLAKRDFTDFAKGMGNWKLADGAVGTVEDGQFVGRLSRRRNLNFTKVADVGPDFTFEFDVHLTGHGKGFNGAPVAIATRQQRQKPHRHIAFRAMQVNTYAHGAFIMDETWRPAGERIAYRGNAKKELAGEQWMHVKLVSKADELLMFVNDWPVHRLKQAPLAERWLNIRNGYENIIRLDNILIRYNPP